LEGSGESLGQLDGASLSNCRKLRAEGDQREALIACCQKTLLPVQTELSRRGPMRRYGSTAPSTGGRRVALRQTCAGAAARLACYLASITSSDEELSDEARRQSLSINRGRVGRDIFHVGVPPVQCHQYGCNRANRELLKRLLCVQPEHVLPLHPVQPQNGSKIQDPEWVARASESSWPKSRPRSLMGPMRAWAGMGDRGALAVRPKAVSLWCIPVLLHSDNSSDRVTTCYAVGRGSPHAPCELCQWRGRKVYD
jgi:hypothetical protein